MFSYKRLFVVVGVLVAAYAWADFLWPPIAESTRFHGLALLWELLKPSNDIYPVPMAGYLFIAVTMLLVVAAIYTMRLVANYIDHSFTPLTVLNSTFEVYFEEISLSKVLITRTQAFHANRSGINAVPATASLDSVKAKIETSSIKFQSQIQSANITKEQVKRPTAHKLDVTEIYERPLPVSLLASLLPNAITRWLYQADILFKDKVVVRTGKVRYFDEYNVDEPVYAVAAFDYPMTSVTIKLNFPLLTGPDEEDIRCFKVQQTAATTVTPRVYNDNGRRIVEVSVSGLKHAQIRVHWRNRRLRAWQEQEGIDID